MDVGQRYLSRFLFILFHFYPKDITFMCRKMAWLDKSPEFAGCDADLGFYIERVKMKISHIMMSVSFHAIFFISISKGLDSCVEKRPS